MRLLEVLDKVTDKVNIEIFTTEVGIPVGRLNLKDTVLDLKDGDIEGITTKIVDSDNAVSLLLETVGRVAAVGLLTIRRTLRPAV